MILNKYRHSFLIGLQSNLVYRAHFTIRAFFSLSRLLVVFILWGAVFRGAAGDIGGHTMPETVTYFVVLIMLEFFIGAFQEDYQISEEIRNGLINQFLLKPINYFLYRFCIYLAARLVTGTVVLIPLLLVSPLIHDSLVFPHELWRFAIALPAIFMSAIIQFSIAYCFGLLTFWFLEIQGFVILSMSVEALLGGQLFPLDLMPAAFFRIAQFLPFYYQMYFPAAILTGRLDFNAVLAGLPLQAAWAALLLGLAHLLWVRGLRHHTAVGG